MEDGDVEVVFTSESVQQHYIDLPSTQLICLVPVSPPPRLPGVNSYEEDDVIRPPGERELLERTICLSDSEEEEGTANVRADKTATSSLSGCPHPQTVPEMVVGNKEKDRPRLSSPNPEIFANARDDARRSPSYDYQHSSECQKVSEAVTRMELKLEGFELLSARLQSSIVILRDLVRYLPVPPSPTVIHEPELDPNDVTIDLITDNEDEDEEPIPPSRRRRLYQNTNENVNEIEVLLRAAPQVSSIEEASPPKKVRVSKRKISMNKKKHNKVPRKPTTKCQRSQDLDFETRRTVYKCGTCSKMFPSEASLRGHIASMKHTGGLVISDLSESQRENVEPLFICCVCEKRFKTEHQLNTHEKAHENTETLPFTCSSCSKRFQTRRGLKDHENRHKDNEFSPLTCAICFKAFKTKLELKTHTEHHENTETHPFVCTVCSKGFKTKDELITHSKRHKNAETRPFVCTVCSKGFKTKAHQTTHSKRHDIRPFICTVCSKGFKTKDELTAHLKRHENAETRPFVCTVCSKGFKTKAHLTIHSKRHDIRPFICTVCFKGWKSEVELNVHKNCHERGKHPFFCTVCSTGFKRSIDFKEHQERHTNAETRPFVCTVCSNGFATQKDLGYHTTHTKCIKSTTVAPSI